jgi:hypothetical protein
MNTRLLRKVAKHIAEEPKRFVMGAWILRKHGDSKIVEMENVDGKEIWDFPKCGTAACINGWGHILVNKEFRTEGAFISGAELFDISVPQAERLFRVIDWPEKFRNRFRRGKTPAARAKVAVARIEHFIKTKGAE